MSCVKPTFDKLVLLRRWFK